MLPYAAYLRVYEPLSAFPEADGRRWAEYAASAGRPRRAGALAAEQAESLRRAIAFPPMPAPERESDHAYVRWSEGVTYICPWQTRLRSWLVLSRLRAAAPSLTKAAFSADHADAAVRDFARWRSQEYSPRVYIQASTWSVPFAWFVPFAADERWLVLGAPGDPGESGRATAAGTRTLVYATAMSQARTRVAKARSVIRPARSTRAATAWGGDPATLVAELREVGSWLEEFHPHSLVELDYGGLVHLLDDGALCADQSVAERSNSRPPCTRGSRTAGGCWRRSNRRAECARQPDRRPASAPITGHSDGTGRLFRISATATIRIARITQRDSDQWINGDTCRRIFAPGGRLVTAGDGNMVSVGHIGHPRQAPPGARQSNNRRIAKAGKLNRF